MRFDVKISMESPAFRDNPRKEVADILEAISYEIRHTEESAGKVFDTNNEQCGTWTVVG
jgi:hypothetical protein